MEHVEHCQKCGKEYNPDDKEASEKTPKCDACGVEVYKQGSKPEFDLDDNSDDEHFIEKGLRKATGKTHGDEK